MREVINAECAEVRREVTKRIARRVFAQLSVLCVKKDKENNKRECAEARREGYNKKDSEKVFAQLSDLCVKKTKTINAECAEVRREGYKKNSEGSPFAYLSGLCVKKGQAYLNFLNKKDTSKKVSSR